MQLQCWRAPGWAPCIPWSLPAFPRIAWRSAASTASAPFNALQGSMLTHSCSSIKSHCRKSLFK